MSHKKNYDENASNFSSIESNTYTTCSTCGGEVFISPHVHHVKK
jgi:RNA polymerase-binding transcription factor DksA